MKVEWMEDLHGILDSMKWIRFHDLPDLTLNRETMTPQNLTILDLLECICRRAYIIRMVTFHLFESPVSTLPLKARNYTKLNFKFPWDGPSQVHGLLVKLSSCRGVALT